MADDLKFSGKWEGMTETTAILKDLPTKTAKAVTRKALRAGAKVMQAGLIEAAPDKSGATKRAIKVRAGKRRTNKVGMVVVLSSRLFAGIFYAGWANYGHVLSRVRRLRAKRQRGQTPVAGAGETVVPGLHWLETASKAAEPAVEAKVAEVLAAEVSKVFKGQQVTE